MLLRRLIYLLPIAVLVGLVFFFIQRLNLNERGQTPDVIPSVMIGKPAPAYALPPLFEGKPQVSFADLKGKVALVDIFASWCVPCRLEHPLLADLKNAGITLVGINYKDRPEDARAWLERYGNPYDEIGSDLEGRVAIDFGSYGIPESYLIDRQGVIRFKQTGPLTEADINETILPLAKELNQ